MIKIFDKNEILNRYRRKESIRSIAKSMNISRNTVRTYVREFDKNVSLLNENTGLGKLAIIQDEIARMPKRKAHTAKKRKFNSEVEKAFFDIINISEQRDKILGTNKQTLTARLIHRTLKLQGYDISESSVRIYYNKYLNSHKECFIRQEYEYGERAEYDFHQIPVCIEGKVITYHQATISAPASNHIYGLLYKDETMQTVMDSLVKFFSHSNGVFKDMVFDNMSTVVKRFILKGEKQYTDDIIKLSNYYGFNIITCNPRSGNEKGHVENSGKVIRRELFSLNFQFESEEELFKYYYAKLDEHNKACDNKWNEEKLHLLPKPKQDYMVCKYVELKVNTYSTVSIDNNYYSVPDKYVGKRVTARIFKDVIIIYDNNLQLATHKKKKGFKEYSIDIMHYINTFTSKPGALKHSAALKQAPEAIKKAFYEDYNMDPKKFIEFLFGNEVKQDEDTTSIEEVSSNQLNDISNIFEQGE